MIFPLEALAPAVQERAQTWTALAMRPRVLPILPNYGKPITGVELESADWLVEILIWNSGEADLSTVRLTDDRTVNKHYDMADRQDLEGLLDELVLLLVHDQIPPAAFVFHGPGTPS